MARARPDRKSTRLNSSHSSISYAVFCLSRRPPRSPLFPYTTLFRSMASQSSGHDPSGPIVHAGPAGARRRSPSGPERADGRGGPEVERACVRSSAIIACDGNGTSATRSEEHTSELQSQFHLVCRLLLEPATTAISTLSLHDALPIYGVTVVWPRSVGPDRPRWSRRGATPLAIRPGTGGRPRGPRSRAGVRAIECDHRVRRKWHERDQIGRAHV